MQPTDRLQEAAKQASIAYDNLRESGEEYPEGLVEEIGELGERLRRAKHGLAESSAQEGV